MLGKRVNDASAYFATGGAESIERSADFAIERRREPIAGPCGERALHACGLPGLWQSDVGRTIPGDAGALDDAGTGMRGGAYARH